MMEDQEIIGKTSANDSFSNEDERDHAEEQLSGDDEEVTSPHGVKQSPFHGGIHAHIDMGEVEMLPRVDVGDRSPRPQPFPLRQFAATPDVKPQEETVVECDDTDEVEDDNDVDEESNLVETNTGAGRAQSPLKRVASPVQGKAPNTRNAFATPVPEVNGLAVPTSDDKHASKMSLVAEIMRTDSFGQNMRPAPSSTGRYKPIAKDDFSLLRPCEMKDYEKSRSKLQIEQTLSRYDNKAEGECGGEESDAIQENRSAQEYSGSGKDRADSPHPETSLPAHADPEVDKQKSSTTDGKSTAKAGGLASTAGFLASIVKWKTKKQDVLSKNEKYSGYLELFNRLSRESMTSLPFPVMLQVRREALPVIQNLAKAYKSTLGPNHQMTKDAFERVEKLRSELNDRDVFL